MSLLHRLKRLERQHGTDKPQILFLKVPPGASDEDVERFKQMEMDRLGVRDGPGKLVIFLVRFV